MSNKIQFTPQATYNFCPEITYRTPGVDDAENCELFRLSVKDVNVEFVEKIINITLQQYTDVNIWDILKKVISKLQITFMNNIGDVSYIISFDVKLIKHNLYLNYTDEKVTLHHLTFKFTKYTQIEEEVN